MEFLRQLFGRRPIDIARRQLRKAERQLLYVERELEMANAVRDYLITQIDRLDVVVKSEGMGRVKLDFSPSRFPFVSRNIHNTKNTGN